MPKTYSQARIDADSWKPGAVAIEAAVVFPRLDDEPPTVLIEADDHPALARAQQLVADHHAGLLAWSAPVRPATADDDAALLALDQRGWSEISSIPSAHGRDRTTFFSAGGRTPEGLLVAERAGALVGMVKIRPKSDLPEAAHVFSLLNLTVSPQARRQGVASALLAVAEHVARARGASKLHLWVLGGNLPAIELYTRHGFELEGRARNEFLIRGHYVDDVSLAKVI